MSEEFPRYGPLRLPEYFFLKTPEKCHRLRVPWLYVKAFTEVIDSPQGCRSVPISWNHMPGPKITRKISTGTALHILGWAKEEGWIE
ncbi:MAG: hypothetical protein GXY48_06810 [Methanomicrobiales archaeon]|mgnify:CR=1 FL=1|nr:hypothetical protein [Methanomicrobiales archaeon]